MAANETIDKLKRAGYITVTDDSQGIADKYEIPSTPTGSIDITENGEHDVAGYAVANVSVSGGGPVNGYFTPTARNIDLGPFALLVDDEYVSVVDSMNKSNAVSSLNSIPTNKMKLLFPTNIYVPNYVANSDVYLGGVSADYPEDFAWDSYQIEPPAYGFITIGSIICSSTVKDIDSWGMAYLILPETVSVGKLLKIDIVEAGEPTGDEVYVIPNSEATIPSSMTWDEYEAWISSDDYLSACSIPLPQGAHVGYEPSFH